MFADFYIEDFTNEIRDHTVKDRISFRYKTKPNAQQSSINHRLQRIGSSLSLEERRLHAWGRSAFAGFKG